MMAPIWFPVRCRQDPSGSFTSTPSRSASGSVDSTSSAPTVPANSTAGSVTPGISGLGERSGMAANEPSGYWSGGVCS